MIGPQHHMFSKNNSRCTSRGKRVGLCLALLILFLVEPPFLKIVEAQPVDPVPQKEKAQGVGIITGVNGKATISRGSLRTAKPVKLKRQLRVGDRIFSSKGAGVEMLVEERALIRMQGSSVLSITRGEATDELILYLKKGIFRVSVSEGGGSRRTLFVTTPQVGARFQGGAAVIAVKLKNDRHHEEPTFNGGFKLTQNGTTVFAQDTTAQLIPPRSDVSPIRLNPWQAITIDGKNIGKLFAHQIKDELQLPLPASAGRIGASMLEKDHLIDLERAQSEAMARRLEEPVTLPRKTFKELPDTSSSSTLPQALGSTNPQGFQ